MTTEQAIKFIKDTFQQQLAVALHLTRVTAPMFVEKESGLNDDLGGSTPVTFEHNGVQLEIVQSLAKWKRMKLYELHMHPGNGIYTDMNAIRPNETLDRLHSLYVDQWDWEAVIDPKCRTKFTFQAVVEKIYKAIKNTEYLLHQQDETYTETLPNKIHFISTEQLADTHPYLTPKEREYKVCRQYGAVCITGIGHELSRWPAHDSRALDYDDWSTKSGNELSIDGNAVPTYGLNGDILVYDADIDAVVELSSMGIRVNAESLAYQIKGHEDVYNKKYHQMILNNELPQTIGGGIGQSRLCMVLLHKQHIGEVQSSYWTDEIRKDCEEKNIQLL